MSRRPDAGVPRHVQISTRWTTGEAEWITTNCATTGENRSEYLRRLVAADRKKKRP